MDSSNVTTITDDSTSAVGSMWILLIILIFIIIIVVFFIVWGGSSNGNGNSTTGGRGAQGPAGPPGPQGPVGPPGPSAMEDAIYFNGLIDIPQGGVGEVIVQLGLEAGYSYTFLTSIAVGGFVFPPSSPSGSIPLRYETFIQNQNMLVRFYFSNVNFSQGVLSVVAIPVEQLVTTTQNINLNGFNTNTFGNNAFLTQVNRTNPTSRVRNQRVGFRRR